MANLLSTSIAGQLTVNSGRLLLQTGGVNTYGIVSGYNNNNHFITMRGSVSGSTSSPTFGGAHQMTFVEYAEAGDSTGWYFKSSSSGTYEEIARVTRSGINWSGNNVIHSGGGQTINGITYFSNGESLNLYGIRGRFANEYIHLYEKVGIGHPGGWGQGEANTPTQGLSIYGGINIAYARDNGATINTYTRINKNWGGGDYGTEAFTIRGTYPSIALRSTNHDSKWLIHHASELQFYYGASADNNTWTNAFSIPTNGDIYMSWAGANISTLLNAKQNASTAITTSNIGSQSVNYALNSTRLYASDAPYTFGGSAPYYMFMTYDGSRWLLQVTPGTPAAVRVSYADSAGSAISAGNADTLDSLDSTNFMRSYGMLNNTDVYVNFRVMRNSNSSSLNDGMYIGYENSNGGVTRIFGGGATSGGLVVSGAGVNDVSIAGHTVWNSSNAPRANFDNLMYYQGFTLDANTMATNSTGFTYAVNAPFYGPIARLSAGGGYDLWIGGSYGGGGNAFYLRTRNGDNGTFNAWREIITSGNIGSQSVSYAASAGDSTNLGGASASRYVRNDIYNSVDAGLQVFRNIGSIDGSWPSSDHTFGLENNDAGTIVVNFHRAGYTSHNLWYNGSQFRFDTVVTSTSDFRAPIFYDSADTTYYLDPNGNSVLTTATFTTNGSSTITLTSAGTNASMIKAGAGDELYLGGNDTWQMRFNSGNVLMDNGGYLQNNQSLRAPIFYDSNDTTYYGDFASLSRVNEIGANKMRADTNGDYTTDRGWWSHDPYGYGWGKPYGSFRTLEVSSSGDFSNEPAMFRIHQWGSGAAEFWKPKGTILYLRETPGGSSTWFTKFEVQGSQNITGFLNVNGATEHTVNDNGSVVHGTTTNNRVFINGSIQLTNNNDAIVIGRGASTFLTDEEIGFGWGGGWYMTDGDYLRVRGNKIVYSTGEVRSGGYRGTTNVGGTGEASWHPAGAYIGSTMWQYGAQYKNNTGIYGLSELSFNNGFNISNVGGSNYGVFNSWVRLDGHYGFYAPSHNNAHIYPNDQQYGAWRIVGTRNGWNGINFDASNGFVTLMVNPSSNTIGFHNQSYGWQFYWEAGTLYCLKNNYGGGTQATVLDSSNFTSWAQEKENQRLSTSNNVTFNQVYTNDYFQLESSRASGGFGGVALFRARRSASSDFPSFSFQHQFGNHSWGQIARFHIEQSGADRPSIQFSSGSSNTRWNVGYCYPDDDFRISQNMGYRPDGSAVTDGWGTERLRINGNGHVFIPQLLYTTEVAATNGNGRVYLNGNMHIDTYNGNDIYMNYYSARGTRIYVGSGTLALHVNTDGLVYMPTVVVNSHSDNTKGYRIHNTSGTAVSAMFVNSSNALVLAAGAVDQINLNKKVYVNGVALGVNVAPSATAGRIDASNDIVAYSSSDERLKENIAPIENALDKVKSLTGVEFDWKPEYKHAHGYEGHDTGIIAQQVEAVMPSAVRTNDTGFLAVRYEKLIGLLIEGMKEQQAQIDELKAKLDGLTK